jgi:hypothetical protein
MSLAADANLAEGLCLHEELELNNLKFLIYPAGTQRPTISRTEGQNLIIIQFNSIYLCAKLNSPEAKNNNNNNNNLQGLGHMKFDRSS